MYRWGWLRGLSFVVPIFVWYDENHKGLCEMPFWPSVVLQPLSVSLMRGLGLCPPIGWSRHCCGHIILCLGRGSGSYEVGWTCKHAIVV